MAEFLPGIDPHQFYYDLDHGQSDHSELVQSLHEDYRTTLRTTATSLTDLHDWIAWPTQE